MIYRNKDMRKKVVLTAIHYKGIDQVKKEIKYLADGCLCSEGYIRSIIKSVEKGQVIIKGA
jgi:hypothetical protein